MASQTSAPMAASDPLPEIRLPTRQLLLIPAVSCVVLSGIWAGAAALMGRDSNEVTGALAAGAVALAAAWLGILLIQPWRSRETTRWPFIFLAGISIQLFATLGGGFLLYFATPFGTAGSWLCLVVCFWAGLYGLVHVYGSHMKQHAPGRGQARPMPEAVSDSEDRE